MPAIARLILDAVRSSSAPPAAEPSDPGVLTRREREVLVLLAKGATYAEVASMLGIGVGTVQGHVKRIYSKLEIGSKAEAAALAQRMGLL
jgi:DNA-binding CsgD family transcriptional regulator